LNSDRKIIFALAIPAVLQTIVRSLFVIIDAFWVGKLGSKELAAITVATFLVWGILALGEMVAVGTNSSLHKGQAQMISAWRKKISSLNILNTLFFSIFLGLAIIPILPLMYWFMNLQQPEFYLQINTLYFINRSALHNASFNFECDFQGYGDTKTPFICLFFAVVLNIFLAPLFIFE